MMIEKLKKRFNDIYAVVTATPHYRLILFLQFLSGTLSFIGLPLLIPVLDYLKDGTALRGTGAASASFASEWMQFFGIEPNFFTMLVVAAVLILTGQFLVFISSLIAANIQANISERYRKAIFRAYSTARWSWLVDSRSGDINYAVMKEADIAGTAHLNAQRVIIYFVQTFILVLVAIKLSAVVTSFALLVYLVVSALSIMNSNRVRRLSGAFNEKFKELSNDLTELQRNKKFFKTSLLNEKIMKWTFDHVHDIAENTKRQNLLIETQSMISLSITSLFLITVLAFHSKLALDYSTLLVVLLVFLKIAPQFAALSSSYMVLDTYMPFYKSLHARLEELRVNTEENGAQRFSGTDTIRFKGVGFSYKPDSEPVFEGLDIAIEPKKVTAFVGSSGAGKSTILDLVLGLLEPDAGIIYYGDIPHSRLDKNSVREMTAYVSQETTLIDGTLEENITIGVSGPAGNGLGPILNKVGLEDMVREMPAGLKTHVGENGIKLSGGQRQRIALARALLREPKILILDEATSSLDAESERMIQDTIQNLKRELTVVIVTHRLSAVRCADKIYVLEGGKVCETGNYRELLDKKGRLYLFDSLQK